MSSRRNRSRKPHSRTALNSSFFIVSLSKKRRLASSLLCVILPSATAMSTALAMMPATVALRLLWRTVWRLHAILSLSAIARWNILRRGVLPGSLRLCLLLSLPGAFPFLSARFLHLSINDALRLLIAVPHRIDAKREIRHTKRLAILNLTLIGQRGNATQSKHTRQPDPE